MAMNGYWFTSSLFEIEPGEDERTNPRVYGRQLAIWLKGKLEQRGYAVEDVIAEDWGWCVMCSRDPFLLWVGCGNARDYHAAKPDDPPPKKEQVTWHCFPAAEVLFWKRIFKKVDTSSAVATLDSHLREILRSEKAITLTDEP